MRPILTFLLLFFLFSQKNIAQLPPPCVSSFQPPVDECSEVCIHCSGFSFVSQGSTANFTSSSIPGYCGTVENDQWLAFSAGATSATFTVTPSNCADGNGVQISLYETCPPGPPIACNGGSTGGGDMPQSITADLFLGRVYYLNIDGFAGDQCDFTLTVDPPIATISHPVSAVADLQGPATICPGGSGVFTATPAIGAAAYKWTAPPGSLINGSPPPVDILASDPGATVVTVTAGPVGGQVCVQPHNCCHIGPSKCKTLTVAPIPPTILPPVSICYEEAPYDFLGIQVSNSGTYSVTLTSVDGCDSVVRQQITIRAPILTNLGPKTICSGQSFQVCGEVFTAPGAYSVVCQSWQGCDSTVNFFLNIPNLNFDLAAGTLTCCSPTSPISVVNNPIGLNYQWAGPGGFASNLEDILVGSPGTYCVTATQASSGCSSTKCANVAAIIVSPHISASAVNIICGAPGVLIGSSTTPGATFAWSGPTGFVSNQSIVQTTTPGTYQLVVTDPSQCCTASQTVTVAVFDNYPDANITGATVLNCGAPSSTLSVPTGTNYTYNWAAMNGGNISSGTQNSTINISYCGTYVVTVTDMVTGCSSTDTHIVTCDLAPPIFAFGGDSTINCASPTANPIPVSSDPGLTFEWQGSAGPPFSAPGTYTVVASAANGCTSSQSIEIVADAAVPVFEILGNPLLGCPLFVVELTPVPSILGMVFHWSPSVANLPNGAVEIVSPGHYTVVATAPNGCTSSQTVSVQYAPPAQIVSLPIIAICHENSGDSISIDLCGQTLRVLPNQGPFQCIVSNTAGCDSLLIRQPIVVLPPPITVLPPQTICAGESIEICGTTISQPGPFSVVCQSVTGCDSTVNGLLQVFDASAQILNVNPVLCQSDTVLVLRAAPSPYIKVWKNEQGETIGTGNQVTVNQPGIYILTVTASSGSISCSQSDTVEVTLQNYTLELTANAEDLTCCAPTAAIVLSVSPSASQFSWSGPANFSSQMQNVSVTHAGNYSVTATDANGCTGTTTVEVDWHTMDPVQATGGILTCEDSLVTLLALPANPNWTYTWTGPNNFVSTLQNPTVSEPGSYQVVVYDSSLCCLSTVVAFVLDSCIVVPTGQPNEADFDLKIYPNTASETIFVETNAGTGLAALQVSDAAGRLIFEQKMSGEKLARLDVGRWPSGPCLLNVKIGGRWFLRKLVVAR